VCTTAFTDTGWKNIRKKDRSATGKKRQGEILLGTLCILTGERKTRLSTFTQTLKPKPTTLKIRSLVIMKRSEIKRKRKGEILLGTLCILAGEKRKTQLRTFT